MCSCSMLLILSSSLLLMNFSPLFRTLCNFSCCVLVVAFMGMGGYSRVGSSSVFMSVVFILGVKFLNLRKLVITYIPLCFLSVMCVVIPCRCNLKPRNFASWLGVMIFLFMLRFSDFIFCYGYDFEFFFAGLYFPLFLIGVDSSYFSLCFVFHHVFGFALCDYYLSYVISIHCV